MSYASYRVKGGIICDSNEIRSHTFEFFQLHEQKTKNPVICVDPYDAPVQFEYQ